MGGFSGWCKTAAVGVMALVSLSASAQMPTPAQLQQFQQLPPDQQRALAQQFGIDLSQLPGAGLDRSNQFDSPPSLQPRQPREELPSAFDDLSRANEVGLAAPEAPLRPFGYDLFASEPTSFEPLNDIPVPSNYVISPGDEIVIQLYGKENDLHRLTVGRDGSIAFPQLENISVSGLTFEALRTSLAKRIESRKIGVQAAISMGKLRTIQVTVTGDAYRPGAYLLNGLSTMSQAIMAAGGFKPSGSLRNIQLKRNGQLIQALDLYQLLLQGDSSQDVRLQSGDTVWIGPVGAQVAVSGEVTRPAIYELKGKSGLDDVIRMSGGTRPQGLLGQILIERSADRGIQVFSKNLLSRVEKSFVIEGGDEIQVPKKNAHYEQAIHVRGAVLKQGFYPIAQGMRIGDIFSSYDRDVGTAADLKYAILLRKSSFGSELRVHQFSLANILNDSRSPDNLLLSSRDELWFFSNGEQADIWSQNRSQARQSSDYEARYHAYYRMGDRLPSPYDEEKRNPLGLMGGMNGEALGAGQLSTETSLTDRPVVTNSAQLREELNRSESISGESDDQQKYTRIEDVDLRENERSLYGENLEDVLAQESSLANITQKHQKHQTPKYDPYTRRVMLPKLVEQLRRLASPSSPLQLVEIRGAVKYPGIYPLAEGIRMNDLVIAAGGYQEKSLLSEAELSRFEMVEGKVRLKHFRVALPSGQLTTIKDETNPLLRSKDKLNIFARSEWRDEINVALLGEVNFPGVYTMQRGGKLSDLIKRAGGITQYAYTKGTVFSRESLRLQEQQRMRFLSQQLRKEVGNLVLSNSRQSFSPQEALNVLDRLGETEAVGRMVIDLDRALDQQDRFDIILEDGDRLAIPAYRPEIQIVGQVQFASNHLYEDRMDVKDYVDLAGGYKRQADKRHVYVIKANGAVMIPKRKNWFSRRKTVLEPGDTIVVPLNINYMDGFSILTTASRLANQVALTAAAFANLSD